MKYSVDTSAILEVWRHHPADIYPVLLKKVLNKIDGLINQGVLIASEEVLFELKKKDDDTYEWAKERERMFVPTDKETPSAVSNILLNHKKLIDERKSRSGADPFVIALAQVERCKVLTGEKLTKSSKRPHIPDVCDALGMQWLNMLQLFREQKWTF